MLVSVLLNSRGHGLGAGATTGYSEAITEGAYDSRAASATRTNYSFGSIEGTDQLTELIIGVHSSKVDSNCPYRLLRWIGGARKFHRMKEYSGADLGLRKPSPGYGTISYTFIEETITAPEKKHHRFFRL